MRPLKALLQPASVAVIGDCERVGERGHEVLANLRAAGFAGPLLSVQPDGRALQDLPLAPDLAILCVPAEQVAEAMQRAGEKGVRAAVVMTQDPDGESPATPLKQSLDAIARRFGMRWMGPRSAGVQCPRLKLNASTIDRMPPAGKLALVSQSASLAASVLAWAAARGIGFSCVATLGEAGNVDAADLLDHLAADGSTQGVLVCLRRIDDGRKFMAAARALARLKPVVVLWLDSPGAPSQGNHPAIDRNQVCRAALLRAGLLQVEEIGEWLDAVDMLGHGRRHIGDRLAIVSNGVGGALLARGALRDRHPLAELTPGLRAALGGLLPAGVLPDNPLDLGVDADAARYEAVMTALFQSGEADALIVLVTQRHDAMGADVARAIAKVATSSGRAVLACWLNGSTGDDIQGILAAANVSLFKTPELAAKAYLHLVRFRRSQDALKQLPEPCTFRSSTMGRELRLSEDDESAEYLRAFGVVSEAILRDETMLEGEAAATVLAAVGMRPAERSSHPGARDRVPLQVVVGHDTAFGRAIEARVGSQRWTLLPALTEELTRAPAEALLKELGLLGAVPLPPAALASALFRVADLLVGFPEISGLAITSFVWDGQDLRPCKPRVWVRAHERGSLHLSLQPYPRETEERITLRDGREILVRPVRPTEDITLLEGLLAHVTDDDRFLRFCKIVKGIPPELLAKMARVDYDRDMAFIALGTDAEGQLQALGIVDAFVSPDLAEAEFSILLRSDLKGTGLGKSLMEKIIRYCRARKIRTIMGLVLKKNPGMRGLATRLAFTTAASDEDDDMVTVTLRLEDSSA